MWDLVGGSVREIVAVAYGQLLVPIAVAGVACVLALATVVVTHRRSRVMEPDEARVPAGPAVILMVVAAVVMGVAATRSDVLENGLLRKPAGEIITWVVNGVTDVDRDGFGIVGRSSDGDPFNAEVFPYAADVPGNGIDEDGVGGDLPAGTAPFRDVPIASAAWTRRPDVVLVVLESFRADVVGAQFEGTPITPVLDGLAAKGLGVRLAYSHNGYTVQSRFHLFSGTLAGPPGAPTLIDDFKAQGYLVGYVSGQDESFGGPLYDIGFGRADVSKDARSDRAERYSTASTPGSLAVPMTVVERNVQALLAQAATDRPLFLCVNFHDTHFPYSHDRMDSLTSPERLSRERIVPGERNRLWATYTNAAANVDRAIGHVIDAVRTVRGAEPGIVVISDHGESLFDGGFLGHGYDLNEAQTRVPLVVANMPMTLPEPFVQADLRSALLAAMSAPAEGGRPGTRPREPGLRAFQYLGDLARPKQIAFIARGGRLIYDFRSDRVQMSPGPWVRPDELPTSDHEEFLALIRYWERIQLACGLARRPPARLASIRCPRACVCSSTASSEARPRSC